MSLLAAGGDLTWWAALPPLAFISVFVVRIRNEEEALVRELTGCEAYRRKALDRLVPFVWQAHRIVGGVWRREVRRDRNRSRVASTQPGRNRAKIDGPAQSFGCTR